MDYHDILYTITGRVAFITLNRPERLNAWTRRMAAEVHSAFREAAADQSVRVIILTGAGRGFCAGADMDELTDAPGPEISVPHDNQDAEKMVSVIVGTPTDNELDPDNTFDARPDFRKRYTYLQAVPKPVIAAINGPAAGLGMIMALYCDIRFASEKARFSTAFSRRGLIAEHGVSWMLPRIVGLSNAMDLLFSARLIDAREALSMGLVNRVIPEERFMEEVSDYANMLATQVSPRSVGIMKKQIYEAQFQTLEEATMSADKALLSSLRSMDFKEGVAHFMEKRRPEFTGS